jgi:penicillin-binding protein 1A
LTLARIRSLGRFFRYLNAALIIGTAVTAGLVGGSYLEVRRALPGPEHLAAYRPRLTTRIFSTERTPDGREEHTLLGRISKEDRELEELRNIPKYLRQATVAIEDRPFYRHRGVDPRGIIRAAWVNLRAGGIHQGGSTITQQLARNMWLTREQTWSRKLKEMILAIELERRFSKDEILEMYLNEVYYGHGAHGVRRAARRFFNKEPKDLTLAECALLAGVPRSDVLYSPYRHPDRAKARRHQVLLAMREQGYITPEEFRPADAEPLQTHLAPLGGESVTAFQAPYFTHYVVRLLCDLYGERTVYEGGMNVYTTLDMRAQEIAEEELTKGVQELRQEGSIHSGLDGQGALACVEVKTGNVIAMVGGVGPWKKLQYNRAAPGVAPWGRQPGSSFKPYIWACGLENGLGPDSVFSGDPISIPLGNGTYYTPKNYTPHQGGEYTLRNALAQSVNLVSVRLVRKLTVDTVRQAAARMLNLPIDRFRPFYSIALGANELSPLEQAVGYCCFASGGQRPAASFVRRITDERGDVLEEEQPKLEQVLSYDTAVSMIAMLRGVITNGTGGRAAIDYPCAGKTGTTNSGRDVWWVGFTPDLSAAVWVGNDRNDPMPRGSGGGFCAPIWARFMKRTMEALQLKGEFPEGAGVRGGADGETTAEKREDKPRTVTVCTVSGGLATPYCPETAERTIAAGKPLPGRCRIHGPHAGARSGDGEPAPEASGGSVTVTVCAKSGLRAGPSCAQTVERTYVAGREPTAVCASCGRGADGGGESGRPAAGGGGTKPRSEPAKPAPPGGQSEE